MLRLGEETEDANKEAPPIQPNRRRKASAEQRLERGPDLENTTARAAGQNPRALCCDIVYCWKRTTEGASPAHAEDGSCKLRLQGPFLDQFKKHVLQSTAPHLGKRLISERGSFFFS